MTQVISFDVGIKNMAYCVMECNENNTWNIITLEKIDLGCNPKNAKTQKIVDATLDVLDDIIMTKIDISKKIHVLIETQMTSIMKCIQTVINTFFKIQAKYQGIDIETHYMSPRHKLNLMEAYKDTYKPKIYGDNVNQYKRNKGDAIDFGEWLLVNKYNSNQDVLVSMQESKKKDDEMDSFLMAAYFVETLPKR